MRALRHLLVACCALACVVAATDSGPSGPQSQVMHADDTGAYLPASVVESGPASSAYVVDLLVGTPATKYRMRLDFSVDRIVLFRDLRTASSSFSAESRSGGTDLVYFNAHHHRMPVTSDPARRIDGPVRASASADGTSCATCDGVLGMAPNSTVWLAYPTARFSSASVTLGWARDPANVARDSGSREAHRESLFSSLAHAHGADACAMRCDYDYARASSWSALCVRDGVNVTFAFPGDAAASSAGEHAGVYRVVVDPSRAYTFVPDSVYSRYMLNRNAYARGATEWRPLMATARGMCETDDGGGFDIAVRASDVIDSYERTDIVQLSLAPVRWRPGYADASEQEQLEHQRTLYLGGSVLWHQFVSTKDARHNTALLVRHESHRSVSIGKLALFLALFLSYVRWKMTNPVIRPDRYDEASPGETAWNCASQVLSAGAALGLLFDGFVTTAVRDIRVLQVGTAVSVSLCVAASTCAAFAYWLPRARSSWRERKQRSPAHVGWTSTPFSSVTARGGADASAVAAATAATSRSEAEESRYAVEFMAQVSSSFKYHFVRNSTHDVLTLTAMWMCLLERRLEFVGTLFTAAVNVYMTYAMTYHLGMLLFFFLLAHQPALYLARAELRRREQALLQAAQNRHAQQRPPNTSASLVESASIAGSGGARPATGRRAASAAYERYTSSRRRALSNVVARAMYEAHNVFFGGASKRSAYAAYMMLVFPALYAYNVYVPYRHFVYPIVQRNSQLYIESADVITATLFAVVVVVAMSTGRLMVRNCVLRKLEEEARLLEDAAAERARQKEDDASMSSAAVDVGAAKAALHHRIGAGISHAQPAAATFAHQHQQQQQQQQKPRGSPARHADTRAMANTMIAGAVSPHAATDGGGGFGVPTSVGRFDVMDAQDFIGAMSM